MRRPPCDFRLDLPRKRNRVKLTLPVVIPCGLVAGDDRGKVPVTTLAHHPVSSGSADCDAATSLMLIIGND